MFLLPHSRGPWSFSPQGTGHKQWKEREHPATITPGCGPSLAALCHSALLPGALITPCFILAAGTGPAVLLSQHSSFQSCTSSLSQSAVPGCPTSSLARPTWCPPGQAEWRHSPVVVFGFLFVFSLLIFLFLLALFFFSLSFVIIFITFLVIIAFVPLFTANGNQTEQNM